jgi:predicted nucleotidyltransferase
MLHTISSTVIPTGRSIPVSQALTEAVRKIVAALNPEKIILFGSFAIGNPTPDSDVDLLIIMDTALEPRERSWQVSRLLIPRQFPVDILVKTPEEVDQEIRSNNTFLREIVSTGLVLYERE